jgi:lipid-A-disaccharide synthase
MPNLSSDQIFFFAGEPSGDLHGSYLLKALKKQSSSLEFFGVGGPLMRKEGIQTILPMEKFQVMGFTDVLCALPSLCQSFFHVRNAILTSKPKAVVLIDYPGFNLRLAASLRKKSYTGKIIQYISPTVWAWDKKRIYTMARSLDGLLTIYPFEPACYKETSLSVRYIGNPLKEYIDQYAYDPHWSKNLGIPADTNLIALFPGSRIGEVLRNFYLQLKAVERLHQEDPSIYAAVSCASDAIAETIRKMAAQSSLQEGKNLFLIPLKYTYELMKGCRTAVAKSGTVTLELALHKKPTVVVYKLTKLNRLIAAYLLKLNMPYYCIVNILRGKQVFPELMELGLSEDNVYRYLKALHTPGTARDRCEAGCEEVCKIIGLPEASSHAAHALMQHLEIE